MKKSNIEIQQELINLFGKNYNNINNLISFLNANYHPQFFKSMQEFVKTPYFHIKGDMSVDEYTDDYISESEAYIIILFDDSRDFQYELDGYHDDVVVCYDKETKKVLKFYYTGYYNNVLAYVQSFIDNQINR